MTSKHTPGPWHYTASSRDGLVHATGTGWPIVPHQPSGFTSSEQHANAQLIARLPVMLEALEKIARIQGSTGGPEAVVREVRFIAREALASITETEGISCRCCGCLIPSALDGPLCARCDAEDREYAADRIIDERRDST